MGSNVPERAGRSLAVEPGGRAVTLPTPGFARTGPGWCRGGSPPLCTPKLKTSIPSQSLGSIPVQFFLLRPLLYHHAMAVRRRRRGFERTGTCSPDQLGLSSRRSRELRLAVAWREVAGETLANRAAALRVSRGTLEVQVDERRWEVTVRALLPRLAARLARLYPVLGVKRCRLLVQDGDSVSRGEAVALEEDELLADREPPTPRPLDDSKREDPSPDEDLGERLARLGERYLARAEGRPIKTRSVRRPTGPSDPR